MDHEQTGCYNGCTSKGCMTAKWHIFGLCCILPVERNEVTDILASFGPVLNSKELKPILLWCQNKWPYCTQAGEKDGAAKVYWTTPATTLLLKSPRRLFSRVKKGISWVTWRVICYYPWHMNQKDEQHLFMCSCLCYFLKIFYRAARAKRNILCTVSNFFCPLGRAKWTEILFIKWKASSRIVYSLNRWMYQDPRECKEQIFLSEIVH